MTGDAAKAAARRWLLGLWDQGDFSLLDELGTVAYRYTGPDGTFDGQAFKDFVRMARAAFPDLCNTIEGQVAEGNKVVTWGTTRGTHRGPLGGMAATGRAVAWPWVLITEFDGDRIASDREFFDAGGLIQQLRGTESGTATT